MEASRLAETNIQKQQYWTRNVEKRPFNILGVIWNPNVIFHEYKKIVFWKLNKFCGITYGVRDLYPIKCTPIFYNSVRNQLYNTESWFMVALRKGVWATLIKHKNAFWESSCWKRSKYENLQEIDRQSNKMTAFQILLWSFPRRSQPIGITFQSKSTEEPDHRNTSESLVCANG